jgi:hypothetical protein
MQKNVLLIHSNYSIPGLALKFKLSACFMAWYFCNVAMFDVAFKNLLLSKFAYS